MMIANENDTTKKTIKWKKNINHTFTLVYKIYYFVCKIYKKNRIGGKEWKTKSNKKYRMTDVQV